MDDLEGANSNFLEKHTVLDARLKGIAKQIIAKSHVGKYTSIVMQAVTNARSTKRVITHL